jgi:hypothetical protein
MSSIPECMRDPVGLKRLRQDIFLHCLKPDKSSGLTAPEVYAIFESQMRYRDHDKGYMLGRIGVALDQLAAQQRIDNRYKTVCQDGRYLLVTIPQRRSK